MPEPDQIDRTVLGAELRRRGLETVYQSMFPGWTPPAEAAM